ncbi:signal transduction histidine kinase [Sanguibacter keddieii DSM 10542]|uniref:histidine kinase n=1 Tax=Sanguibacter keddieii (strain ATCC 51767 / DSM 10542 / NCFB 3025 / ST-74) TaxID=446469 RepID=D1BBX9_SANKS|nr:PAS domain-containing sensor histidine kinase [Sanguibacter keddieii]ACZ20759.1 signal transduction histidine kinase [Sanguibacter keddieii DSM 10542]
MSRTAVAAEHGPTISRWSQALATRVGRSARGPLLTLQIPLAATVSLVVLLFAATAHRYLTTPTFALGVALVFGGCAYARWAPAARTNHRWAPVVVCLVDFTAIGLLRYGTHMEFGVLGVLSVFPAAWLAHTYLWRGAALATVSTIAVTIVPELASAVALNLHVGVRVLLLPLIVAVVTVAVVVITEHTSHQERVLQREHARLDAALTESESTSLLLDAMLESLDTGLLAVDSAGKIIRANTTDRDLYALTLPSDDGTSGARAVFAADRTSPLTREKIPSEMARRGEGATGQLMWLGLPSGPQRAISANIVRIVDSGGVDRGALVASHDVTELMEAIETKDRFVGTVSHELRTPLTSIMGYLELIAEDDSTGDNPLSEETREYVGIARRNAEQLLSLVSDLLTTAQIDSGALRLTTDVTTLSSLVADAVEAARPRFVEAGITLTSTVVPTVVQDVDRRRMAQVIENLLSNALKYTPAGGTVTVTTSTVLGSSVMTVSDTGIGMSRADLGKMFTKFFRAESARTARIQGFGLGLVICRAIVEAHGGKLRIDSTLGRGTKVSAVLPVGVTED